MTQATFVISVGGVATFTESDSKTIGFVVKKTGNRSTQSATITINNNELGNRWSSFFTARASVNIVINGVEDFDGFVEHIAVTDGVPGSIIVECVGRTARLKDSEVRPIVYDDDLPSDERDFAGVSAEVIGGQIQLPQDAKHIPIDQIISVKDASGNYIISLNADLENGIIFVDQKYNGQIATVSYTCFRSKFEDKAASDIVKELINRHGKTITTTNIATISTVITFEPSRFSDLFVEIGRIRDILGGTHDFFLDKNNDVHFFVRSGGSVATILSTDVHSANFSVDYSAYANKVIVRSSDAKTNSISQERGIFEQKIEGLTKGKTGTDPDSEKVDVAAQGFKSKDVELRSFQLLAKRETEEDAIIWDVTYNGKRSAINENFTASHSLTPDSTNIKIDAAGDRIFVLDNGAATAYFSSDWQEDLNQDSGSASTAVSGNIFQTITVSNLTRKKIKGIAFKSPTAVASQQFKFEIYSGTSGNTGTLLGTSETETMNTASEMETDWFATYFSDPVDVSAQTNISIVLVAVSGSFNWTRDTANPYAGGQASTGAGDDFTFQFFTVVALKDILAGVAKITDSVTAANKTPQYFISRDYQIGSPDFANWMEVINNTPRLFQENSVTKNQFGFKISFNSASTTGAPGDPVISVVKGSVAYIDVVEALDEPSGIIVGGLSGTAESDVLPFFNIETGSFTKDIETDTTTRLEPNGNYWLSLKDGNPSDGAGFFTTFYDDGSDASFTENWLNTTNVNSSSNFTIDNGEAKITRNTKTATMISKDLFTTTNAIAEATVISKANERGGRVLPMVSRNKRNYYYPGKSTVTTNAPILTGEVCILQFDAGDVAINVPQVNISTVKDVSGNGFDLLDSVQNTVAGKYGNGWTPASNAGSRGISQNLTKWIMYDFGWAEWCKPTTLADNAVLFSLDDGTEKNIEIMAMLNGQIKVRHTYNGGASTETFTTDNTNSSSVLANGVFSHVGFTRNIVNKEYKVYIDGVLKNTFVYNNIPDTISALTKVKIAGLTRTADEIRVWPRVTEDWVLKLVADFAYDSGATKFTFPVESDSNDDYTDTLTTADGVKKNLRVAEFFWPAPFQSDDVLLRMPMNRQNSTADFFDISSYAHSVNSVAPPTNPTIITGGAYGEEADFNGSTNGYFITDDTFTRLKDEFSFLHYIKQDVIGTKQTFESKKGEFRVEVTATSASATTIDYTINGVGGVTRTHQITGAAIGTARKHLTITYDKQTLKTYIDSTLIDTKDFGSVIPIPDTTNAITIGNFHDGTFALGAPVLSNFFDGKIDELIYLRYVIPQSEIDLIKADASVGQRSPIQLSYVASAYSGVGVKAYTDGKYMVSRDEGDTFNQILDGVTANTLGSLVFKMSFGKVNVQCIRKDETEINRLGFEVGRVFDVPFTDIETLCSIAEGYLELLSSGVEKGTVKLDGRTDLDVGEIVTISYPQKNQNSKEYAVATTETTVTGGIYSTRIELGEEERAIYSLFGTSEVGIK